MHNNNLSSDWHRSVILSSASYLSPLCASCLSNMSPWDVTIATLLFKLDLLDTFNTQSRKTESCRNTSFVVSGGIGGSHYDNLRCRRWRQSGQHDNYICILLITYHILWKQFICMCLWQMSVTFELWFLIAHLSLISAICSARVFSTSL